MELISIIVPTHNSRHTILRALASIESQDWQNLEVICVDDASDDDTPEIVREYAAGSRLCINIIVLACNSGPGIARNAGLDQAKGDYIAFLDADDEWYPKKLTTQYNAMRCSGAKLCHTFFDRVMPRGATMSKSKNRVCYRDMLIKNHIGTSTVMVRRDFLATRRFPIIRKRQDYGLWLELLRDGNTSLAVKMPLTKYYVEKGSLSRTNVIGLLKYNYLVFRECEGFSVVRSVFHVLLNTYSRLIR